MGVQLRAVQGGEDVHGLEVVDAEGSVGEDVSLAFVDDHCRAVAALLSVGSDLEGGVVEHSVLVDLDGCDVVDLSSLRIEYPREVGGDGGVSFAHVDVPLVGILSLELGDVYLVYHLPGLGVAGLEIYVPSVLVVSADHDESVVEHHMGSALVHGDEGSRVLGPDRCLEVGGIAGVAVLCLVAGSSVLGLDVEVSVVVERLGGGGVEDE